MVLYSEFTYRSQFSEEKNGLEIRFLVPEILSKYKRSIFLRRPVSRLEAKYCVQYFQPQSEILLDYCSGFVLKTIATPSALDCLVKA